VDAAFDFIEANPTAGAFIVALGDFAGAGPQPIER